MSVWKQLRTPILILTFFGIVFWGKSILIPVKNKAKTVKPFVFPSEVPLPGWQAKTSHSFTEPWGKYLFQGRRYEYGHNDLALEVEMSYVNHPHPNEKRFRQYDPSLSTPDEPGAIIRHQKETGFYSLSIEKERVYLRACINPRGPSAITYAQFIHNRYTYDLQFARLLPVLLGQEPLRDHRCLWTHLSIPVKNASFEADYQVLEKVWLSWYQWWYPRFPKR